jgi:hypothetical protein
MGFHAKQVSAVAYALRQEEQASPNGEASTAALQACREAILAAMREQDPDLNWKQARSLLDAAEVQLRRRGITHETPVLSMNRLEHRA